MGPTGDTMNRLVALSRSPAYSPRQHLENDRAILDAVVERMAALQWQVQWVSEQDVERGGLPEADLYLNMCQGRLAALRLQTLLPRTALCINPPDSVLACHRHELVARLAAAGISFPPTTLLATQGREARTPPVHRVADNGHPVWVKRGDVHAQRSEDVVAVPAAELPGAIAAFAHRGIKTVALQAHIPGPVVKFYGVIGPRFFRWYPADPLNGAPALTDALRLQRLAERAARAVGLAVYGGDAVITTANEPILIDLNDWPSFAPVRSEAAAAIARYAHRRTRRQRYSCSSR